MFPAGVRLSDEIAAVGFFIRFSCFLYMSMNLFHFFRAVLSELNVDFPRQSAQNDSRQMKRSSRCGRQNRSGNRGEAGKRFEVLSGPQKLLPFFFALRRQARERRSDLRRIKTSYSCPVTQSSRTTPPRRPSISSWPLRYCSTTGAGSSSRRRPRWSPASQENSSRSSWSATI